MKLEQFKSRFAYIQPGQVLTFSDGYTAAPQNSTWFFIEDLEAVRSYARRARINFRPFFRGSRSRWHEDKNGIMRMRPESAQQTWCLKADAKFFVIGTR